ncbi:hypothetical protein A2U01_0062743, partial [Trifolium medium]|nr:hypothetical protein [Trifolium medium]
MPQPMWSTRKNTKGTSSTQIPREDLTLEAQEEAEVEAEITSQPVKSATKLVTQPWAAITSLTSSTQDLIPLLMETNTVHFLHLLTSHKIMI